MVTPISNDKILSSDSANSAVTGKKKADQGVATQQNSTGGNRVPQEENAIEGSSVDVERANQIYNSSASKPAPGRDFITNLEQAKAVAAEIRVQMEENSQQAFKAQTGASSTGLAALLEAVPA